MLGIKGDFVTIHEGVIGSRLGEKLHHQRDRIDQHEERGENDISVERKFPPFRTRFKQVMQGEGLGENVAAGFILNFRKTFTFLFTH